MPTFLISAWTWFTNNKWAQYVALGFLIFFGMKRWEHNIEAGVRRQDREKNERERAEDALKVDNQIRGNSDAMVTQADRIRAANPVQPDVPGELREPTLAPYDYRD